MTVAIAVAIVNYNTREYLRACLASVLAEAPAVVVVVDNASSDGSADMVQTDYPEVVLDVNRTNLGYGAAANQAVMRCTTDYVLLLNSDTMLQPGTLKALVGYLDSHPKAALVGPRLVHPDHSLQASCYPFPTPLNIVFENSHLGRLIQYIPILRERSLRTWPHTSARIVPWVLGAALAIRRQTFTAIGGFDSAFFMYFEEVDFCYRLTAAGWEVHFAPMPTVVHIGGASTRQYRTDMAVELFASAIRFYRRHHSGIRLTAMSASLKGVILARWIIDTLHFHLTWDPAKRAEIAAGIAAWRYILQGYWRTRALQATVRPDAEFTTSRHR
jgi:GT2 family glycosyltransferase